MIDVFLLSRLVPSFSMVTGIVILMIAVLSFCPEVPSSTVQFDAARDRMA